MSTNRSISRRTAKGRHHAGMTLAEVLVATTIFVVAAAIALILYDSLTQSYKKGNNAADVQQNTRIGFDQLVTHLRMAGFNYNPDGADRPDEQIEGAWETAVTVRGDFDFEDPTASANPEVALASGGSPYNVVSVGNDEIITYALAKPDGTGGSSVTFVADVDGTERDGTTETVTISNIALVQDDPPYTLYRITVNPGTTSVTRTPVADNIYSMTFRYLDSGSAPIGPLTPGDPSDDIGGDDTEAAIADRAAVRRLEISLTGMTPDPDLRYTDPSDPYPDTQGHRKFTLVQEVSPRNLGFVGRADMDVLPPSKPTNLQACAGHCNAAVLSWDPPSPNELVTQWTALRNTSPSPLMNPEPFYTNFAYYGGMTAGTDYYFAVRAEDGAGNVSALSDLATPQPITIADATTPSKPAFLQASGDSANNVPAVDDQINVTWGEVTTNVESVSCDPNPQGIRDLQGYRLYRSESSGFIAGPSNVLLEPTALPAGTTGYTDTDVVACRPYYYDIRAVDDCGNSSASQPGNQDGLASTTDTPVATSTIASTALGPDSIKVNWAQVTKNTSNKNILVEDYRVYRAVLSAGMDPAAAESAIDWVNSTYQVDTSPLDPSKPDYVDNTAMQLPPGQEYYYRVSALTDCPSPFDEGPLSQVADGTTCDLGGYVMMQPYDGETVTGTVPLVVDLVVTDAKAAPFSGYVVITNAMSGVEATYGDASSPVSVPFSSMWDTSGLPPGDYTITATVMNTIGCWESHQNTVTVTMPIACCIAPLAPVLGPTTGKLSQQLSDVVFSLVNQCGQDLTVSGENLTWTENTGTIKLNDLCYDVPPSTAPEDCVPVIAFPNNTPPPVSVSLPGLPFGADRDDLNPLIVGYKFDAPLVDQKNNIGELITIDIFFRPTGAAIDGQCTFLLQTDPLSVSGGDPVPPPP